MYPIFKKKEDTNSKDEQDIINEKKDTMEVNPDKTLIINSTNEQKHDIEKCKKDILELKIFKIFNFHEESIDNIDYILSEIKHTMPKDVTYDATNFLLNFIRQQKIKKYTCNGNKYIITNDENNNIINKVINYNFYIDFTAKIFKRDQFEIVGNATDLIQYIIQQNDTLTDTIKLINKIINYENCKVDFHFKNNQNYIINCILLEKLELAMFFYDLSIKTNDSLENKSIKNKNYIIDCIKTSNLYYPNKIKLMKYFDLY